MSLETVGVVFPQRWERLIHRQKGGRISFPEWSNDYRVGIGTIDHGHRVLFILVNRLHDGIKGSRDEDAVGETLDGLIAYLDTHFAREEQYRDECGYPELVQHAKKNRKPASTVHSLKTLFDDDPEQLFSRQILEFLEDWLAGHVLKSDMDSVPTMTGEKKGLFMGN